MKEIFKHINFILTALLIIIIIFFSIINIIYIKKQDKIVKSYIEENDKLTLKINNLLRDTIYNYNGEDKVLSEKISSILKRYNLNKTQFIKYLDFMEDIPFAWPLKDKSREIIKGFGLHISKRYKSLETCLGVVIRSNRGSIVTSTAPGIVDKIIKLDKNDESYYGDYSDTDCESEGYAITIEHEIGFVTTYSNLENVIVKSGEEVKKGQLIGYSGKNSENFSFLYYNIKIGDRFITPYNFLLIERKNYYFQSQ